MKLNSAFPTAASFQAYLHCVMRRWFVPQWGRKFCPVYGSLLNQQYDLGKYIFVVIVQVYEANNGYWTQRADQILPLKWLDDRSPLFNDKWT
jgi:hypothetical protein